MFGSQRKNESMSNPSEAVKKFGESVERRYLQSFRIAAFDRQMCVLLLDLLRFHLPDIPAIFPDSTV